MVNSESNNSICFEFFFRIGDCKNVCELVTSSFYLQRDSSWIIARLIISVSIIVGKLIRLQLSIQFGHFCSWHFYYRHCAWIRFFNKSRILRIKRHFDLDVEFKLFSALKIVRTARAVYCCYQCLILCQTRKNLVDLTALDSFVWKPLSHRVSTIVSDSADTSNTIFHITKITVTIKQTNNTQFSKIPMK